MKAEELIKNYINFFKKNNHKEIENSSLIPEHDPTILFTTAGMHPLVPFLLEQKHPQGKRLVNNQKCIRTGDINLVGEDPFHLSFFEMLGNWSLGDYWKEQAIKYSYEFITKNLKINPKKIHITIFKGNKDAPKDKESEKIWLSLKIPKDHIYFYPKKDNWWGPAGSTGPCGPCTEMFIDTGIKKCSKNCKPGCTCGKYYEIWNNVFMQYNKTSSGKYKELKQKNVDTGMGVERTIAILQNKKSVYETELFLPIIRKIEKLSGKKYGKDKETTKAMRIIADHIKAAVFIMNDNVLPNNKERGYVLRRLIRRAIVYGKKLGLRDFTSKVAESVFDIYPDYFPKNDKRVWFVNRDTHTYILDEIDREEMKFLYTIEKGLKILRNIIAHQSKISPREAFLLYQSYGFPIELTEEILKDSRLKIDIIKFTRDFEKELAKHQTLSRTAAEGKFKGGLADDSYETTKLHTANHLLLHALRKVLHKDIMQRGSNITPERLRFDFNFDRKLTDKEIKKTEDLVNKMIKKKILVVKKEMSVKEAKKLGAKSEFTYKTDKVFVYIIDKCIEICMGPHIKNTKELGKFKIIKQESSSAGVRRIRAMLG